MEKKTIGQFIAALRKANGMTQKELAEKLNVSDKAVSRWERDESAPDLSLIPVIAEIFGVTSDEILRGERAGVREAVPEGNSEKGKKQIAHLLGKSKTKFQMYSLISIGIASAGLLAAMICNIGFLRAHIGFFVACIFFVAALICESIFFISTKSAINIDDVEEDVLASTKGYVIKWMFGACIGILSMFGFCLPLVTEVPDAYWGLEAEYWFPTGLIVAGVVGFGGMLVIWILSSKEQNVFASSEKEILRSRLKLRYVKVTALVLIVTGIVHIVFSCVAVECNYFAKGTTFDNYEDFVEYMETPVEEEGYWDGEDFIHEEVVVRPGEQPGKESDVDEDSSRKEQLLDKNGNVLCEYRVLNHSIGSIDYGPVNKGYLPITVYTRSELSYALQVMNNVVNPIWAFVYILEATGGIFLYFRKRNK